MLTFYYKGYTGRAFWMDAGYYYGEVYPTDYLVDFRGYTAKEAEDDFQDAVDQYIADQ